MAISVLQSVFAGTAGTAGSQTNVMAAITAGSMIVLQIDWGDATSSISSITDTRGNTYIQADIVQAQGQTNAWYYAKNSSAGANTITVTFSGMVSFPDVSSFEVAGFGATTQSVDQHTHASGASGNGASGSITNTQANSIFFGALVTTGTPGTPTAGWTEQSTFNSNNAEYLIVSATGAQNAAWTGTTGAWVSGVVNFIDAPAGGGTLRPFSGGNLGNINTSGVVPATGRRVFRSPRTGTIALSGFARPDIPIRPFYPGGINLGTIGVSGVVHGRLNAPNQINATGVITFEQVINPRPPNGTIATLGIVTPRMTAGILRPLAMGTILVTNTTLAVEQNPLRPFVVPGLTTTSIIISGVVNPRLGFFRPAVSPGLTFTPPISVTAVVNQRFVFRPSSIGAVGGLIRPIGGSVGANARMVQRIFPPTGSVVTSGTLNVSHFRPFVQVRATILLTGVVSPRFTGIDRPGASGTVNVTGVMTVRLNPLRPFNVLNYSTLTIFTSGQVNVQLVPFKHKPPDPVFGSGWNVVAGVWGAYYTVYMVPGVDYSEIFASVITSVPSQQAGIAYQIVNGLY